MLDENSYMFGLTFYPWSHLNTRVDPKRAPELTVVVALRVDDVIWFDSRSTGPGESGFHGTHQEETLLQEYSPEMFHTPRHKKPNRFELATDPGLEGIQG